MRGWRGSNDSATPASELRLEGVTRRPATSSSRFLGAAHRVVPAPAGRSIGMEAVWSVATAKSGKPATCAFRPDVYPACKRGAAQHVWLSKGEATGACSVLQALSTVLAQDHFYSAPCCLHHTVQTSLISVLMNTSCIARKVFCLSGIDETQMQRMPEWFD